MIGSVVSELAVIVLVTSGLFIACGSWSASATVARWRKQVALISIAAAVLCFIVLPYRLADGWGEVRDSSAELVYRFAFRPPLAVLCPDCSFYVADWRLLTEELARVAVVSLVLAAKPPRIGRRIPVDTSAGS